MTSSTPKNTETTEPSEPTDNYGLTPTDTRNNPTSLGIRALSSAPIAANNEHITTGNPTYNYIFGRLIDWETTTSISFIDTRNAINTDDSFMLVINIDNKTNRCLANTDTTGYPDPDVSPTDIGLTHAYWKNDPDQLAVITGSWETVRSAAQEFTGWCYTGNLLNWHANTIADAHEYNPNQHAPTSLWNNQSDRPTLTVTHMSSYCKRPDSERAETARKTLRRWKKNQ